MVEADPFVQISKMIDLAEVGKDILCMAEKITAPTRKDKNKECIAIQWTQI